MNTNNYKKALASLDKLQKKDVRLKTAYQLISFNQGVSRFQSSDFLGAISSFSLVKQYPIDEIISGKALYWTADANYKLKNYELSIQQYKAFLLSKSTLFPNLHKEAQYNIGYAYLKMEQTRKSIEAFRFFLQSENKNKKKEADALMRVGDGYYVLKENEQATKYYKKVLELKTGAVDQALFYLGKTYGYMGRPEKKIPHLLDIINNYKNSKYLKISIHEVAETYNSEGDLLNALKYYNKIIYDYPASILVVGSKINIADIYFKQANYNESEVKYNMLLNEFGDQNGVCEKVVRGLMDIYKAQGNPEKVEGLVSKHTCANLTAIEQEELYYLPAMERYSDSSYQEAIDLFKKYLTKFSSGRYSVDVKNYLANSYYVLGDTNQAITIYKESLIGVETGFTELSASRVSHYLYNKGLYLEAIPYYEKLELISSIPEVIFNSEVGLMRTCFLTENWSKSIVYCDKILKNQQTNNTIKLEAHYAKGMSNYYNENYKEAKIDLVWTTKNTTNIKSAEASYVLAEMLFYEEQYNESNNEITKLLKQKPTHNYWIAKALILRSKTLIIQKELFQSEQNLKSILEHYPISDDGIIEEANQLWNELMQLKNQPKNIPQEINEVIEINENEQD